MSKIDNGTLFVKNTDIHTLYVKEMQDMQQCFINDCFVVIAEQKGQDI